MTCQKSARHGHAVIVGTCRDDRAVEGGLGEGNRNGIPALQGLVHLTQGRDVHVGRGDIGEEQHDRLPQDVEVATGGSDAH